MNESISAPASLGFYIKQIILTPSEENFKLPNLKPEAQALFGLKWLLIEINGCSWSMWKGFPGICYWLYRGAY